MIYNKEIAKRAKTYAEAVGDEDAALHFTTGALWMLSNSWREFSPRNCPPFYTDVLVLGETGDVAIRQIIHDSKDSRISVWYPKVKCKITHWMPIPKYRKYNEI